MENYFVRNLETQKIELYFDKATYQALSEELKKDIKSNCLFSNYKKAWISRAKINNTWRLERVIKLLSLTDNGTTGEKLSFAEQVEVEQERAANRLDISEQRADKANDQAHSAYERAHTLGNMIPFGQPILVGHHSEKGHRAHIKKIDNAMRQSCDLTDKAKYYENKAENAEYTATGAKFNNAGYLVNRIKESQANVNVLQRRLEGKFYIYSTPKPINEEEKIFWSKRIEEETEKLNFYTGKLKELSATKTIYSKETLTGKTEVKIEGRWRIIVKCNPTTISVENTTFRNSPELMKKYALKYNYGQVQEAK